MRDKAEARKIRAEYNPIPTTRAKLEQSCVVEKVVDVCWRAGNDEQHLVTYHVAAFEYGRIEDMLFKQP